MFRKLQFMSFCECYTAKHDKDVWRFLSESQASFHMYEEGTIINCQMAAEGERLE